MLFVGVLWLLGVCFESVVWLCWIFGVWGVVFGWAFVGLVRADASFVLVVGIVGVWVDIFNWSVGLVRCLVLVWFNVVVFVSFCLWCLCL